MAESQFQILLAEDNPADVYLVRKALETADLAESLEVVDDGEKAVTYIEEADRNEKAPRPDLLLLDLNLPRKSGHEVLARLRLSPNFGDIPVVVISSSGSPRDQASAMGLGANHYFQKPSEYHQYMQLGNIVKDVLREYRAKRT